MATEKTHDGKQDNETSENNPARGQQTISATDHKPPAAAADAITSNVMGPFFAEQLTAFEIWLEYASQKARNTLLVKSPSSSMGGTPLSFDVTVYLTN